MLGHHNYLDPTRMSKTLFDTTIIRIVTQDHLFAHNLISLDKRLAFSMYSHFIGIQGGLKLYWHTYTSSWGHYPLLKRFHLMRCVAPPHVVSPLLSQCGPHNHHLIFQDCFGKLSLYKLPTFAWWLGYQYQASETLSLYEYSGYHLPMQLHSAFMQDWASALSCVTISQLVTSEFIFEFLTLSRLIVS